MKKRKGAVTVFLIIVLFSTTLLGGLFIDASRVLLAKRYIRNVLNTSARSALSYYDIHMAEEYGLFAVDKDMAESQFRRYFKTNLELAQNDGFNILSMEVQDEDITVTALKPLWDDENMLDSMEEYSKYRSLVNTTIGVVEKLKGLFGGGGAAQKTFNAADTGKTALEKLQDDVKELSNSARTLLSTGLNTQANRAKESVSNLLGQGQSVPAKDRGFNEMEGTVSEARETSGRIEESRQTFQKVNEEEAAKLETAAAGSAEYWDEDSQTWKSESGSESRVEEDKGTRSDLPSAADSAKEEKEAVDSLISATERRLAEKKNRINSKIAEAEACNREIATLTATVDTAKAQTNVVQSRLDKLKENKLRDRFSFILGEDPDGKTEELQLKLEQLQGELELLQLQNASAAEIQAKEKEVTEAGEALETYLIESTGEAKTPYDDEIKNAEEALKTAKSAQSTAEKTLKNTTEKRDALIKDIEKLYDEIAAEDSTAKAMTVPSSVSGEDKAKVNADIGEFVTGMIQAFESAKAEFGKRASSVSAAADYTAFSFGLEDLLDDALGTVNMLVLTGKSIVRLVTDPEAAGEAFLMTDYVFSNFTFLTSQTARSSRHFRVGEIEYILNGNLQAGSRGDFQAACITDTVMDIAMLRLTINWVDYMCTTHSPELFSRMLIALGRAAIRTLKDMAQMIFTLDKDTSASCPLAPSFEKVRLTYSDHLRLAMLIKAMDDSERRGLMDRLQLMMADTYTAQDWGDPANFQTRLQGEVTVEVDLVMLTLPMFEKVLPEDNQILQNGKFLVHETVALGY